MLPDQDETAPDSFASKARFQRLFALLPGTSCWLGPSLLFGILVGEWGCNPLWGSYFGLGWCLSAFWSGDIVHDRFSTGIGMAWGWFALLPLHFGAGWLWDRTGRRGRRIAVRPYGSPASPFCRPARCWSWTGAAFTCPTTSRIWRLPIEPP